MSPRRRVSSLSGRRLLTLLMCALLAIPLGWAPQASASAASGTEIAPPAIGMLSDASDAFVQHLGAIDSPVVPSIASTVRIPQFGTFYWVGDTLKIDGAVHNDTGSSLGPVRVRYEVRAYYTETLVVSGETYVTGYNLEPGGYQSFVALESLPIWSGMRMRVAAEAIATSPGLFPEAVDLTRVSQSVRLEGGLRTYTCEFRNDSPYTVGNQVMGGFELDGDYNSYVGSLFAYESDELIGPGETWTYEATSFNVAGQPTLVASYSQAMPIDDAGPGDPDPVDSDPVDPDPVDSDPVDPDPVDSDPVDPSEPGDGSVINIAGESRYETAVQASMAAYSGGADTVVIATGRNWPDALGGSALAGVLDAPILLVNTNSVPDVVSHEIERLGAERAVIVGGEVAVGPAVAGALRTAGLDVERIAGGSRYETADLVAARVIAELGDDFDGTAFVATGGAYADAVAAGPLAASQGWPLFLAHPTAGLRAPTLNTMQSAVADVLVLGGTAAVSPSVEAALRASFGVRRLAGGSRYETAVAIAEHAVANTDLAWDRVGIATGQAYPDALAGGVLQGKIGSVMLLTRTNSLPEETAEALAHHKAAITMATFFGGSGAVSTGVRSEVTRLLAGAHAPTDPDPADPDPADPDPSDPDPADDIRDVMDARYGSFAAYTVEGHGDDVVDLPASSPAGWLLTATHAGNSNFIVWAVDAEGDNVGLIANEIGAYSGTAFFEDRWSKQPTHMTIQADGEWTLRVSPVSEADILGESASGVGETVLLYDGQAAELALTHEGSSNFIVRWYGDRRTLLVNEIGEYQDVVSVDAGPAVLSIEARRGGAWSVSVTPHLE